MRTPRQRPLEPRREPTQGRSRATVAAILEAAARVFAASGYAGATTNHIARRAGVSIGSLYEYFPSKDAILVALVERHVDEAEHELAAALRAARESRAPLPRLVRRLVEAMVALHARDPGLHRVLFEEAPLPPRVRARIARLERAMAQEVAELLHARGFARADAAAAARLGVEVLEALTHRLVVHEAAAGRGREETAAQVQEIALLLAAYLAEKGRRSADARGSERP
jgi:AcrR family transcriptional regulator